MRAVPGWSDVVGPESSAVAPAIPFNLVNGMETSLFLLVLMLCVEAWNADRLAWLPVLCALALLARLEGGAIGLVVGWQLWRTHRMPPLRSFAPAAALLSTLPCTSTTFTCCSARQRDDIPSVVRVW